MLAPGARRALPPEPFKDWTEARAARVNLARWWSDILAGIDRPPLYSWEQLARGAEPEGQTEVFENLPRPLQIVLLAALAPTA